MASVRPVSILTMGVVCKQFIFMDFTMIILFN